ncbi:hypothetical protein K438DRAFT_1834256 [Mycena galopus ATCC 62051]|nr:hypothetical protein K438DRAFT_1834256 [Mycena galopus ATCC 62051]
MRDEGPHTNKTRMNGWIKTKRKACTPRTANSSPLPPAPNTQTQKHIQSRAAPRTHLPACPRTRMPICRNHEQIVSTARWKVHYT